MKVLAYSFPDEPLTEILLKNSEELGIIPLNIKELLEEGEIFDTFDENKTHLNWSIPSIGMITNSTDLFLINRVNQIPSDWFRDFDEKDRQYAQNELWAYLTFALQSFPNATEYPGIGSLFGDCLSLTAQWKKLKDANIPVVIPEFFFGPRHFLPKDWEGSAIFSEVFQFYSWKPNECPENKKNNVFAIKRPSGTPIVAFNILDETLVFSDEDKFHLTGNEQQRLVEISKHIHNEFNYFCSEILFFVENGSYCFGMINNTPWASKNSPLFEPTVLKVFKEEGR